MFEEPLRLFADPEDILFAISSSGRSENILRAVRQARIKNCRVFTLSGFRSENPLRQMGDINFYIPGEHYGMVELAHQILIHCITDLATCPVKTKPMTAFKLFSSRAAPATLELP